MRHRWNGKITKRVRHITCIGCGIVMETSELGYLYYSRDAKPGYWKSKAGKCPNDLPKSLDDINYLTRDEVVPFYVDLIKNAALNQVGDNEISELNQKIIARWSLAALEYIKVKAWAQIEK